MKRPAKRTKPLHPDAGPYRQLWRLVDGAVVDALNAHPDYLSTKGYHDDTARRSIVKRVVGAVLGYAGQATTSQRGAGPVQPRADGRLTTRTVSFTHEPQSASTSAEGAGYE